MNQLIRVDGYLYTLYFQDWFCLTYNRKFDIDEEVEHNDADFEKFDEFLGLKFLKRIPQKNISLSATSFWKNKEDLFEIIDKKRFFAFLLKNQDFTYELENEYIN